MLKSRYTFLQMTRIVWAVGWSDFTLKYRGSILGYLWSLLAPLAKFLVIYYVFKPLVGGEIAQYPLYLFLGIIMWEHFTVTTTHCMTALKEKQAFFLKIPFPRMLIMLIVGWTNMIIFLTHFLIFVVFVLAMGGSPWMPWLYLPILLLQMTLFALGVGMLLASYCLKYRDIQHLWGILSQVLFWLTPITYVYRLDAPISTQWGRFLELLHHPTLHTTFDLFVQFQPLSILIYDMRRVTLYAATQAFPSLPHILGVTAVLVALFTLAARVYHYRSQYFIEEY